MADDEYLVLAKWVPGGRSLGFDRLGRASFVEGAMPGEQIAVISSKRRTQYREITQWKLISAHIGRIDPPCRYVDQCGGCDWLHVGYQYQLEAKQAILRDALRRIAKIDLDIPIHVVAEEKPFAYRHRLRLHFSRKGDIGLYRRGSHEVVAISDCAVVHPSINSAISALRDVLKYSPDLAVEFESVEIRVAGRKNNMAAHFFPRPQSKRMEQVVGHLQHVLQGWAISTAVSSSIDQVLHYEITDEVSMQVPSGSFVQVNLNMNRKLIQHMIEMSRLHQVQSVWDLYCGCGNFSLPLFSVGITGFAADSSSKSIDAAKRSAEQLGIDKKRFVEKPAEQFIRDASQRTGVGRPDLLIIDPPRSGVGTDLMNTFVDQRIRYVAMISCDPATLARDLLPLLKGGYRFRDVSIFDMFPQTHHFETMVWLELASTVNHP